VIVEPQPSVSFSEGGYLVTPKFERDPVVEVDGKEIQELIFSKIAPACDGHPMGHVILGMLTFTILLLKPQVEIEELRDCVLQTSEFMTMTLDNPSKTVH
jgi:hypothetical protein